MNLLASQKTTQSVSAGKILAVVAEAGTTGSVIRLAIPEGGEPYSPVPIAGASLTFGPYSSPISFRIECSVGEVAVSVASPDPFAVHPTLAAFAAIAATTEALAAFQAGAVKRQQVAPASETVTAALTAADLLTGLIVSDPAGAAATYTLPLGSDIETALGASFAVDDAFEFSVTNISANILGTATLATNTGLTLVGGMTFAANSALGANAYGTLRVRKTAADAYTIYRVA